MAGGTAPGHLGDLLADGSARGDVVGVAMRVEDLGTVNGQRNYSCWVYRGCYSFMVNK